MFGLELRDPHSRAPAPSRTGVLVDKLATRYVVVWLTRTNRNEYTQYSQLFLELDNLIVQNNQKPKPVC